MMFRMVDATAAIRTAVVGLESWKYGTTLVITAETAAPPRAKIPPLISLTAQTALMKSIMVSLTLPNDRTNLECFSFPSRSLVETLFLEKFGKVISVQAITHTSAGDLRMYGRDAAIAIVVAGGCAVQDPHVGNGAIAYV